MDGDIDQEMMKFVTPKSDNNDPAFSNQPRDGQTCRIDFDVIDGVDLDEFFQDDAFDINNIDGCHSDTNPPNCNTTHADVENLIGLSDDDQLVPRRGQNITQSRSSGQISLGVNDNSCDLFESCVESCISEGDDDSVVSDAELSALCDCKLRTAEHALESSNNSGCNCVAAKLAESANASKENNDPLLLVNNSDLKDAHDNKSTLKCASNIFNDSAKSFLFSTTPLTKQNSESFALLGSARFSPSVSPPLVSTRRRHAVKAKAKTDSPVASADRSFMGSGVVGCGEMSELDSSALHRIFSGEDPDTEFSLIL